MSHAGVGRSPARKGWLFLPIAVFLTAGPANAIDLEPRSGIALNLPNERASKVEKTKRGASFIYRRGRLVIDTLWFGQERSLAQLYSVLTGIPGRTFERNELDENRNFRLVGRDSDGSSFHVYAEVRRLETRAYSIVLSRRAGRWERQAARNAASGARLFAAAGTLVAVAMPKVEAVAKGKRYPAGFHHIKPGLYTKAVNPDFDPSLPCDYRLVGAVRPGLLDTIKAKLVEAPLQLVCLNSPGGSFVEAVKIAAYFKQSAVSTKIEAGARCESACALIFMAGSYYMHSVGHFHWRVLHPAGKLGFHAPKLLVKDGGYVAGAVEKAYDLALQTIADTVSGIVMHKEGFAGSGPSIRSSLLAAMLRTPHSRMQYVDTVDQAGRWEIAVGPIATNRKVLPRDFERVCNNHLEWLNDKSAIRPGRGGVVLDGLFKTTPEGKARLTLDEFHGSRCDYDGDFRALKMKSKWIQIKVVNRIVNVLPFHYFSPATPLIKLSGIQ
ncbi:MAG: hypothetical protein ACR2PI_18205 [Hyphomicrobiaceae bacterium]